MTGAVLQNFEYLFSSDQAFRITRKYTALQSAFIVLGMVLGVAVAILVNEVISKAAKAFLPDGHPAALI